MGREWSFNQKARSWMGDYVTREAMLLFLPYCDGSYLRFTTTQLQKLLHDILDALGITVAKGKRPFDIASSPICFLFVLKPVFILTNDKFMDSGLKNVPSLLEICYLFLKVAYEVRQGHECTQGSQINPCV